MQIPYDASIQSVPTSFSLVPSQPILPCQPAHQFVRHEPETVDQSLRLVEKLFPTWVIILWDEQHRIRYSSANSVAFFGTTAEALKGRDGLTILDAIHSEDAESYARIQQKVEELLKGMTPDEVPRHRMVLNYRYRTGNGSYRLLHEEKLYAINPQGQRSGFSVFKDITGEKPFTRVNLEWYRCVNGIYRRVGCYVPAIDNPAVTQREVEIIKLLKEGMSSKEIADRLFISINTVRNHRSNLFKKTNAKNVVELLNLIPSDALLSA